MPTLVHNVASGADIGGGSSSWQSNSVNCVTASTCFATNQLSSSPSFPTNTLRCSFNSGTFNVPSNNVSSIQVSFDANYTGQTSSVKVNSVKISIGSSTLGSGTAISTTTTTYSFGSGTLWGAGNPAVSNAWYIDLQFANNGASSDVIEVQNVRASIIYSSGTLITASVPLFIHGSLPSSGSLPLYLANKSSISGNFPLFLHGSNTIKSGLPLFLANITLSNSGNIPLFLQNQSLFKCKGPFYPNIISVNSGLQPSYQWSNPNYIERADNLRAISQINSAGGVSDQLIATNFSGISNSFSSNFQLSGIYFLFKRSQNVNDNSVIDDGIYLVTNNTVQSGADRSIGLWNSSEQPLIQVGSSIDLWNKSLQFSDITNSGFGIAFRAATNSNGVGTASVDSVACYICGLDQGTVGGIPMYMPVEATLQNDIPLFIWGKTLFSSGIPLVMSNVKTSANSGLPLFLQPGSGGSAALPLYLKNYSLASGGIPLHTAGANSKTGGIDLFLKGKPIFSSAAGIPLSLSCFTPSGVKGGQFSSIPLFLASPTFSNGMTLFLAVPSIGHVSDGMTLYTAGYRPSATNSIPIYLENGYRADAIPLWIKGLNPFPNASVNSDGFYPFAGNLALYLKCGPNAMSTIPLFLPSNTPLSGNIPLYIHGALPINSGIPLFLDTGHASGHSQIPMFIRGF